MGLGRRINIDFWIDTWVEGLNPVEKLCFVYLFSCPQTNPAGLYKLSVRRMAFDCGISEQETQAALAKFEADGKVLYDEETAVIWVRNFRRYHNSRSATWLQGVTNAVNLIPECRAKDEYLAMWSELPETPSPDDQESDPSQTIVRLQSDPSQTEAESAVIVIVKEQVKEQVKGQVRVRGDSEQAKADLQAHARRLTADPDPPSGDSDRLTLTRFPEEDADLIRQALELRDKAQGAVTKGEELDQMFRWAEEYGAQALRDAAHKAWTYTAKNPGGYIRTILESGENGRNDPQVAVGPGSRAR